MQTKMNTVETDTQTVRDGRTEKTRRSRAELLADRIEQGAATLAAFVAALSEAEWQSPVWGNGRDARSIAVIVHHVASSYPIEIDLARTIASGKPVKGVTAEVVDQINAKHAAEHVAVTKTATLELLRRNSRA